MSIRLKTPYKIVALKEKRYHEHYRIPVSGCLVVPLKRMDEEVLCEVYWQDHDGINSLYNLMFTAENLEPINNIQHETLFTLWERVFKPLER